MRIPQPGLLQLNKDDLLRDVRDRLAERFPDYADESEYDASDPAWIAPGRFPARPPGPTTRQPWRHPEGASGMRLVRPLGFPSGRPGGANQRPSDRRGNVLRPAEHRCV